MKYLPCLLLGAAAIAYPANLAQADTQVRVSMTFDMEVAETEVGAEQLMHTLHERAERACSQYQPIIGKTRMDELCVEEIMVKALAALRSKMEDAGHDMPIILAALESDMRNN